MLTSASVCYENFVSILNPLSLSIQMDRNEETTNIRDQEDQATLSLTAFDKEKLVAVQQQAPEGMTPPRSFQKCLP